MIEMKDISVGYDGKTSLGPISLTLPEKKLIAVVGPNGAGKSTLLKVLARLITPHTGTVTVNEKNAFDYARTDYAKIVSYLSQSRNLPDMTVEQLVLHGRFPYIGYPRKYTATDKQIAHEAMAKIGVAAFADRQIATLSGGERQKAYIAMALSQNTEYILLDEPTVYLDVSCSLDFMKTLRELADSGKGVVAVLHDIPLALNFADAVAVLQGGNLIAYDSPKVLCEGNVFQDVFGVRIMQNTSGQCYYSF